MDTDQLLQQLRDLGLEEGRQLLLEHAARMDDHAVFGILLADEALEQLYTNPAISLKLAELLTFFGDHIQHLSSHALGLKAKGDALRAIGFHQAAIDALDAAGAEFLQLGDEGNWARSRISWILAASWLGRVDDALQEAQRARAVFVSLEELHWACIIDHNIAYIYEQLGRYQDALKLYEQTLMIYPTLIDQSEQVIQRDIAMAQVNQAIDLALLGNFEQAYVIQQYARDIFLALEETSMSANSEVNLADLDYAQGYYGSALQMYYQALDTLTQKHIGSPILLSELKLKMARCLLKLEKTREARQLAEEAVEIHRQTGISLQTSDTLREYAVILIASGKLEEALVTLDEAATLFSSGGLTYYAAITKLQKAELLLRMGYADQAYEQAHLLKTYFDDQNLLSRSVQASMLMANALTAQPEGREEAIALAKQIVVQARQHNLQEEVYKSHALLGDLFTQPGSEAKAAKHYKAAIAQVERMLDNLAYDLSPTFLHSTWTIYEEMITLCLQQSQFEHAFGYLERVRSIALRQHLIKMRASHERRNDDSHAESIPTPALQANSAAILRLQQELHEWQESYHQYSSMLADTDTWAAFSLDRSIIERELKQCEIKLSETFERLHLLQSNSVSSRRKKKTSAQTYKVDITQLRQQLKPGQCLLAYFFYKGKLVIFAMTTGSFITQEIAEGGTQIEHLLPFLHAHLLPEGWPDIQHPPQEVMRRLLNKFYAILIAPIADALPPLIDSFIIVPYGFLYDVPFHALYDGSQFLIERFQVSYLPASSLLTHLRSEHNEPLPASVITSQSAHRSPLILGYVGNGEARHTLEEATMLATLLGGRCYLEQDATIARLIEQAPGSPIIHIATHGRARLDAPHFSSVLLADGQFNAIDAFQLDVKSCELITLSGCDTGKALIGGGDEQLGLARAFLAAGATSLVISLWPVEDTATNIFMQHFYRRLLQGDTKVEALRSAQYHLLHHYSPIYTHPYFWAAFRLVGDTGSLSTSFNVSYSAVSSEKLAHQNSLPTAFH